MGISLFFVYILYDLILKMAEINDFFIEENSIEFISDEKYKTVQEIVENIDAIARTTYMSLYVIDYYKQNFLYVSDNPLFLCGMAAETVKELGYNFYMNHVVPEDLQLLLEINTAGFKFLRNVPINEVRDYTISYDFFLKNKDSRKKQLINHQITPLRQIENGKVWLGLCVASISSSNKSGNIKMLKNKSGVYWNYNRESKKWKEAIRPELKPVEKEVLKLSAMGYTMCEIADEINRSFDTVKAYRKNIFEKLGVNNISEAISYVMNHRLF